MLESFLKVRLVHSVLINHLSMSGSFVHTLNLFKEKLSVCFVTKQNSAIHVSSCTASDTVTSLLTLLNIKHFLSIK